jgi:hypothetical protein
MMKSTVLGAALLAGMAVAARAQSIAAVPPASGMPEQSALTQPYGSTQSLYPKPGGGKLRKHEHYQTPADAYAADPWDHPYSARMGPKIDSSSDAQHQIAAPHN